MMPSASVPIIVVTRPSPDHLPLCEALRERGFETVHSPAVERIPEPSDVQSRRAEVLGQCALAVVTSPYAAELLLEVVPSDVIRRLELVTPGFGTARMLEQAGCRVCWPESGGTSEDLLRTPAIESLRDGPVGIVGAPGGRRLLDRELGLRGIRVERINLYRRRECPPSPALIKALNSDWRLIVLVSSVGGFEALDGSLETALAARWRASAFIASSERVAERCRRAKVRHVVRADGASDAAMLAALAGLPTCSRGTTD